MGVQCWDNVGGINSADESAVSLYLYNHFVTLQYLEISEGISVNCRDRE